MLVDAETLDVRPMADSVLALVAEGAVVGDVAVGPVTWSNELALHVIEIKATEPIANLSLLAGHFEQAIRGLRRSLDRCGLRLLPTAMHPWMNPAREVVLWPHENHEIYANFHRVFGCKTHGWGNVQCVHLNLPFDGDE